MKTILFSNISFENSSFLSLDEGLEKLRNFAVQKSYKVIAEYQSRCGAGFGVDPVFNEILEFINSQDEKIKVLCYEAYRSERSQLYKDVLKKGLVEIESITHYCFKEIAEDKKNWRYLTLPKFIDLLESESLFFCRADVLRSLDKSEASYLTSRETEAVNSMYKTDLTAQHPHIKELTYRDYLNEVASSGLRNEDTTKEMFINCWHINDLENFAMWKIYSEDFGVCIQSSFKNLYESFNDSCWSYYGVSKKIYAGKVSYINWNKDSFSKENTFSPFMHKRKEFEYEQELRCLVWNPSYGKEKLSHVSISVDVQRMVEVIYINPVTPSWFKPLVESLCIKYGFENIKVVHSKLAN